jgi:hypothetical protein
MCQSSYGNQRTVVHKTIREQALRQRGVDADIARLAAHVGIQLFFTAYVHWLEAGAKADLASMSESVMSLLASIVPTNATATPLRARRGLGPRPSTQTIATPGSGAKDDYLLTDPAWVP